MKNIKRTVTDINANRDMFANILTDGIKVWADTFTDCNSYCQYTDKNIKCIGTWKTRMFGYSNIKMSDIKDMIKIYLYEK
jgi:hypothetical protein